MATKFEQKISRNCSISIPCKKSRNFKACKYGVVEFKYATLIFDRAKGVAMATKIMQE